MAAPALRYAQIMQNQEIPLEKPFVLCYTGIRAAGAAANDKGDKGEMEHEYDKTYHHDQP